MHVRTPELISHAPPGSFPRAHTVPAVESVAFPSWRSARDQACALLLSGATRIVVTGLSGTGKTLLIEDVARILRSAGWDVDRQLAGSPLDSRPAGEGGRAALLIDDAEQLSEADLMSACLSEERPVLLAGSEALKQRCPRCNTIDLQLLEMDEARVFIQLWQAQAGVHDPLDDDAVARLLGLSGGIPRLLAILLNAGILQREISWVMETSSRGDREIFRREPMPQRGKPPVATANSGADVSAVAPVRTSRKRKRSGGHRIAISVCLVLLLGAGAMLAPESAWPVALLPLRSLIQAKARQITAETGLQLAHVQPVASEWLARAKNNLGALLLSRRELTGPDAQVGTAAAVLHTAPETLAESARPQAPAFIAAPPQSMPPMPPMPPPPVVEPVAVPKVDQAAARLSEPATIMPAPASTPAPAMVTATAAPATPSLVEAPLAPKMIALLLRRGDTMMSLGDYSAARLLFARAVSGGSTAAMVRLGRTYDPATLSKTGAEGLADPVLAAGWFAQAAAAGVPGAAKLLASVEQGDSP